MTLSPDDLRRIAERTLAHYDQRATDYWEGTRDHDVSQNIKALLDHIQATPPFDLLDFGCGPGRGLRTFKSLGHRPVAWKAPAEELMDLVAMLPWWADVLLALLSYVLLHRVAAQPLAISAGGLPTEAVLKGLATGSQYLAPVIFLAGAGMSAWRRKERQSLVANATQNKAADALGGISWREFEMLVGEGFRLQG